MTRLPINRELCILFTWLTPLLSRSPALDSHSQSPTLASAILEKFRRKMSETAAATAPEPNRNRVVFCIATSLRHQLHIPISKLLFYCHSTTTSRIATQVHQTISVLAGSATFQHQAALLISLQVLESRRSNCRTRCAIFLLRVMDNRIGY